jgi:hypothetical protein
MNIRQEQLKTEVQKLTADFESSLEKGTKCSASIMRYAKAKYEHNSIEIKDFEGK